MLAAFAVSHAIGSLIVLYTVVQTWVNFLKTFDIENENPTCLQRWYLASTGTSPDLDFGTTILDILKKETNLVEPHAEVFCIAENRHQMTWWFIPTPVFISVLFYMVCAFAASLNLPAVQAYRCPGACKTRWCCSLEQANDEEDAEKQAAIHLFEARSRSLAWMLLTGLTEIALLMAIGHTLGGDPQNPQENPHSGRIQNVLFPRMSSVTAETARHAFRLNDVWSVAGGVQLWEGERYPAVLFKADTRRSGR